MQVLLAVIDDLWQFAYSAVFGMRHVLRNDLERERQATLPLVVPESTARLPLIIPTTTNHHTDFRSGEQYFIGESAVYLYSDPVIAFDTAQQKLSYGQVVFVKKLGGRWAEVVVDKQSGWLLKDVLRERREDIHPQFVTGESYDAHHLETIKLRACIEDEFSGAEAGLPLLPAEYVTYKLSVQKRHIEWDHTGPRLPGTWQKRLRGFLGIHMSISPSTHTVMEYIVDDIGHLAFVEAVFPDRSIKLSEVGEQEDGVYSERTLSPEEYRELAPVFIEIQ